MENREKMQRIINYLEEQVEAAADCCGKDDDINYKPAKNALELAKELMGELQKGGKQREQKETK